MERKSAKKFKVVIVGAGPTGLLLARILSRLQTEASGAEVEFIILERRSREEIARPEHRAALVIWPNTMRVMDQLGLLDGLREMGVEMGELGMCDALGREFYRLGLEDWTATAHGANPLFFHRPEFVRFLYDNLPSDAQDKIITGKTVKDIQTIPEHKGGGVFVICQDGTHERGDVVIGADGVHSRVREVIMQQLAHSGSEVAIDGGGKQPFVAEFQCLFGYTTHLLPGLEPERIYEMHSSGRCSQVFTFKDKAGFMVYRKMERPSTSNESVAENAQGCDAGRSTRDSEIGTRGRRYTKSDVEDFIRQMGELPVVGGRTSSVTVSDLYTASRWTVLSDLHEGIIDEWHAGGAGRMVLVGDAVSKQTPNTGQGWNCGVQDVMVLGNLIASLVMNKSREEQDEETVTIDELDVLFKEYQRTRYPLSRTCLETSMKGARSQAWDGWWYWFLDRYVQTTVSNVMWATKIQPMVFGLGPQIHLGHVLDFLPERSKFRGAISWAHVSPVEGGQDREEDQ